MNWRYWARMLSPEWPDEDVVTVRLVDGLRPEGPLVVGMGPGEYVTPSDQDDPTEPDEEVTDG